MSLQQRQQERRKSKTSTLLVSHGKFICLNRATRVKFPNLMHCAGCEHLTTIFLSLSEIGQGPCELALGEFTYNIIDKLIELQ